MKKLLLIILILPKICLSQVDEAVDARIQSKMQNVDAKISAAITTFSKTLDSVITKQSTQSGAFIIDTLEEGFYQLSLTGISGNNKPSCVKVIYVTKTNGIYSITRNTSLLSFSGLNGGNFDAFIDHNKVLVKITGTSATTQWTFKKINL